MAMPLTKYLKRFPIDTMLPPGLKPRIFMQSGVWVIRDPRTCIDYKFLTIRNMQNFFRNGRP